MIFLEACQQTVEETTHGRRSYPAEILVRGVLVFEPDLNLESTDHVNATFGAIRIVLRDAATDRRLQNKVTL